MSNTMHRRTLLELIPHYNESIQNKAFLFIFVCMYHILPFEGGELAPLATLLSCFQVFKYSNLLHHQFQYRELQSILSSSPEVQKANLPYPL